MQDDDYKKTMALGKSHVRVIVTYISTGFLFGGGSIFIAFLINTGQRDAALSILQGNISILCDFYPMVFADKI